MTDHTPGAPEQGHDREEPKRSPDPGSAEDSMPVEEQGGESEAHPS